MKVTEFKNNKFGLIREKHLVELLYPLLKNIEAISLNGTTLNNLIQQVEMGNDIRN